MMKRAFIAIMSLFVFVGSCDALRYDSEAFDETAYFWECVVTVNATALDEFLATHPSAVILAAADVSGYNAFHRIAELSWLCLSSIRNQSTSNETRAADFVELARLRAMFNSVIRYCGEIFLDDPNAVRVAVNKMNHLGFTPLHGTTGDADFECTRMLLTLVDEHGQSLVDVNARSEGGHTPLILAAREGAANIVDLLLQHRDHDGVLDVDVNTYTLKRETALMWAAIRGHPDVVSQLLHYRDTMGFLSVDVNLLNENNASALTLAAECDHLDVVVLLAEARDDTGAWRVPLRSVNNAIEVARQKGHEIIAYYLEDVVEKRAARMS